MVSRSAFVFLNSRVQVGLWGSRKTFMVRVEMVEEDGRWVRSWVGLVERRVL